MTGFEPVTSSLPRKCSTSELHRQNLNPVNVTQKKGALAKLSLCQLSFRPRAGDQVRTGDPQLGRLMLYQLSYSRQCVRVIIVRPDPIPATDLQLDDNKACGQGRIRTSEVERHWIYSPARLTASVPVL